MNYQIQGKDFGLTPALVKHTERQLKAGLAGFRGHIQRVSVRLGDTNGPGGGEDKYCRVQVQINKSTSVFIEGTGPDLYSVISQAVRRASRNVNKRIDKVRRRKRSMKIAGLAAV
jgi:ribosome-associated translation inhibitor RaiA